MKNYTVSYMCVYSDSMEAEDPAEAAKIAEMNCPYDIDGNAVVTDDDGNEYEVDGDGNVYEKE